MKTAFFAFCITLFVLSCKKDKKDNPPVTPNPADARIKTSKTTSGTQSFEYDAQGRSTKVLAGVLTVMTVEYGANTVTENEYGSGGTLSSTSNILLNAQGLAASVTKPQYPNLLITYEYNGDKTVSKKTVFSNSNPVNITWYFYQDGNLIKDSSVNYPGLGYNTRIYEYYTDMPSTLENVNWGIAYWGTSNKNPLKKVTYYTGGVMQQYQNYMQPEADAKKRITRTGYQNNGIGAFQEKTYTYL